MNWLLLFVPIAIGLEIFAPSARSVAARGNGEPA